MLRRAFSSSIKRCIEAKPSPIPRFPAPERFEVTDEESDATALWEAQRRKRKTEWKRRQGGQSFLDHLIINVRGGHGGNGCVAFHREKFKPFGPPSGGNGGRGGDVYILPTPHLTSLSSLPKKIRGENGGAGHGTWQNGKNGVPMIIKVPLGTVVRELVGDDTRRAKTEWEAEEESLRGLSMDQRRQKMREKRWVHYPRAEEDNLQREAFVEAEVSLYKQERERRWDRQQRALAPIFLDLEKGPDVSVAVDAPLGIGKHDPLGDLIASGGNGGLGNPHFVSQTNRSPKFATCGLEGERVTLYLELKLLADVGLVGMPNAGKSTLLRALTGGRAKSEVAGYAFTTLNPVVGVVRVADDGSFEGETEGELVYDETRIEMEREKAKMADGYYAESLTRNQANMQYQQTVSDHSPNVDHRPGHHFDIVENFRFTIADNPGLISRASENIGLGHSFLRSMERSLALAYVVDLSAEAPWEEVRILRDELEAYLPGMSQKARIVVANKADLLAADKETDPVAVADARAKLARLEEYVRTHMLLELPKGGKRTLDVVPTSAKFSQNIKKVVTLMKGYVEDARVAEIVAAEEQAVEDAKESSAAATGRRRETMPDMWDEDDYLNHGLESEDDR